jgi:peptide/nickel transport system substrate-binding protein
MKKTLKIVLSFMLIGIFSSAFANSIKWSMPGDSLTLDPHAQNEGPTHMVSRQIYEGLVTPGINMEILPQLAESWVATADDTWIFNIRRGVMFHDGSSLTAGDIAFSINRARTAPSDMVVLHPQQRLMTTLLK